MEGDSSPKGPSCPTSPAPALQAGRSKSTPSLPHAYNLRQYSIGRRRLAAEPGPVSSSAPRLDLHPLSQIDLAGGNGRWRQRRAKEQWVLDQAEAEKQRRERQLLEDEKRRRREEREARRRKQQQEDQQRLLALEEKRRLEILAQEERERQEAEERRLRAEQEERDWLARQPKTCTDCGGSGKCTACGGKGVFFALFLAPSVGEGTSLDYGRAQQGCPGCGGYAQNICGAVQQGSGKCLKCDGVGMVTPKLFEERAKHRGATMHRQQTNKKMTVTGSELQLDASGLMSPGCRSPAGGWSSPGGRAFS